MSDFNKIAYFKFLRGVKLPGGAAQVLMILYSYSDPSGGSIRPGVKRLAGDCCMGQSTVKEHLKLLRNEGLIVRESDGGRSGDGRSWADTYRLAIPTSTAENSDHEDVSTSDNLDHENDSHGPDLASHGPDLPLSWSENLDPIKYLSSHLPSRRERGAVQDPRPVATVPDRGDALSLQNGSHNDGHDHDPEPPEFCPAHMPHGTSTPCRGCKTARINHERWKDRQAARWIAEMRARDTTPPPQPVLDEIEPEIPDPEPDPDAPVCATEGCTTPAMPDGVFCGRCSTHRQLTEPDRHPADGNSTGDGTLAATAKKRRQQVAA